MRWAYSVELKRLNDMQETLGPRPSTTPNQAQTVTCPICGACVGFRCVDHTGQIVSYHVERARAARWAEMDAPPPFLGVVCEQNSHWGVVGSIELINITWRHRLKFDSVPAKPR